MGSRVGTTYFERKSYSAIIEIGECRIAAHILKSMFEKLHGDALTKKKKKNITDLSGKLNATF